MITSYSYTAIYILQSLFLNPIFFHFTQYSEVNMKKLILGEFDLP